MATDTMQPMPVIFQRTPTEASARTPNTKDTIAAKIALLIHLRSFAKLKYFLSNLLAANGLSKPFADGKSTGDSCISGARGCSHLDGTK